MDKEQQEFEQQEFEQQKFQQQKLQQIKLKSIKFNKLPKDELAIILESIEQTEIEKKRVSELGKRSKNPSEETLNIIVKHTW